VVANLAHVDARLARRVAESLSLAPDAKAAAGQAGFRENRRKPVLESSPSLSMEGANGHSIATRRIAVLVAPGVEVGALRVIQQALQDGHATPCLLSERVGSVATASGQQLAVERSLLSESSVLFDAVIVPGGRESVEALMSCGCAVRFVLEAYKHCKTICVIGEGVQLLRSLGLDKPEEAARVAGVIVGRNEPPARAQLAQDFIAAIARHRHWTRPKLDTVPA